LPKRGKPHHILHIFRVKEVRPSGFACSDLLVRACYLDILCLITASFAHFTLFSPPQVATATIVVENNENASKSINTKIKNI